MVYLVSTTWYPPAKQPEVLKIYLQLAQKYPPQPELGETVVDLMVTVDEDGIKAMSIFKVNNGKYEEALTRSHKMLSEYWGIEGYRYTVKTWSTLEEAFAILGEKPPE